MFDINGDARPDFVIGVRESDNSTTTQTYLRTDTGWQLNANYQPDVIVDFAADANGQRKGQFVDINGDGLFDWVSAIRLSNNSEQQYVWLNTGDGWNTSSTYNGSLPQMLYDYTEFSNGIAISELIDINGDGLIRCVFRRITKQPFKPG